MRISHVPRAYWAALVVSALGFVVSMSSTTMGSPAAAGTVTACSFLDLGPLVAAAGSVALTLVALGERRRQHVDARASVPWVLTGVAVVAALAVVHVLRGLGVLGGPC
ncbi:hypothetical protein [Agrococcus jejuensis]|nr:hypothetical protein [Agrococcus jejuensis]